MLREAPIVRCGGLTIPLLFLLVAVVVISALRTAWRELEKESLRAGQ